MRGIILTDNIIATVEDLAAKLRYTVSNMAAALALTEQLRLVRVEMAVSHPVISQKEKRPYSNDLEPLTTRLKVCPRTLAAAPPPRTPSCRPKLSGKIVIGKTRARQIYTTPF